MKPFTPLIAIAALTIGSPVMADDGLNMFGKAFKKYAGRQPISCIPQRDIRSTHIVDRMAIIYLMNDGKKYVNRPESGAELLDEASIMVTDKRAPQLCDIHRVKLIDRGSRSLRGFLNLGKFLPYSKKKLPR